MVAPKIKGRGEPPPPLLGTDEAADEEADEEEELILRRGDRTQEDIVGTAEISPASSPGAVRPSLDTPPVKRPVSAASIKALGGVGSSPGGLSLRERRADAVRPATAALAEAREEGLEDEEAEMIVTTDRAKKKKIFRPPFGGPVLLV